MCDRWFSSLFLSVRSATHLHFLIHDAISRSSGLIVKAVDSTGWPAFESHCHPDESSVASKRASDCNCTHAPEQSDIVQAHQSPQMGQSMTLKGVLHLLFDIAVVCVCSRNWWLMSCCSWLLRAICWRRSICLVLRSKTTRKLFVIVL